MQVDTVWPEASSEEEDVDEEEYAPPVPAAHLPPARRRLLIARRRRREEKKEPATPHAPLAGSPHDDPSYASPASLERFEKWEDRDSSRRRHPLPAGVTPTLSDSRVGDAGNDWSPGRELRLKNEPGRVPSTVPSPIKLASLDEAGNQPDAIEHVD